MIKEFFMRRCGEDDWSSCSSTWASLAYWYLVSLLMDTCNTSRTPGLAIAKTHAMGNHCDKSENTFSSSDPDFFHILVFNQSEPSDVKTRDAY